MAGAFRGFTNSRHTSFMKSYPVVPSDGQSGSASFPERIFSTVT
jgi:hypothetical protein